MDDAKKTAKKQIIDLWALADRIESSGIDQDLAQNIFGLIYAKADEIAESSQFTMQDLTEFEEERRLADMHWRDRVQHELGERVSQGENPLDISFG